jgi:hypothetical protein
VHPPNEKPGREWQCTRHWCHGDADPWYAGGGAREGQADPRIAASEDTKGRAAGAQLCDELLFGAGVYASVREKFKALKVGLGRIVALFYRPSTLYQIHEHIGACIIF